MFEGDMPPSRVTAEQSERAEDCGAPEGRETPWEVSDRRELSSNGGYNNRRDGENE